jgi:ArsR family transcriptional regulator
MPKNIDTGGRTIAFRHTLKSLDKNIDKFAAMFKALSNPNRLRTFMRLISCCRPGKVTSINPNSGTAGCACVGEPGEDLGIVPSTVSHHIRELRLAGLIRMERRGQKIECFIDPATLKALKKFFS